VVAQIRDVNASIDGCFQHHLTWLGFYRHPVDSNGYVICHILALSYQLSAFSLKADR
jgi:hypothetical protein